jgi:antitoxin component YwqK of YwqJK toxin-antitoxin module
MIEVKKEYYPGGTIKNECHYLNGYLHREDGPALISYYEDGDIQFKTYYKSGFRHREDGPALIGYNENGDVRYKEYWSNGRYFVEKEWFNQLSAENKLKFTFGPDDD